MDYSLEGYLDEDDYSRINKITNDLDVIMDDLFLGKKMSFLEIIADYIKIDKIENEYLDLINKHSTIIEEDVKLLSSTAGKSFIISGVSILSAYLIPFMFIPSIIGFARGMKHYTAYRVLKNKDVVNEYLSTFDNLKDRLNHYDAILKEKCEKIIEDNNDYLLITNAILEDSFCFDKETEQRIVNLLNKELNCNSSDINELFGILFERIEEMGEEENKTLILKK